MSSEAQPAQTGAAAAASSSAAPPPWSDALRMMANRANETEAQQETRRERERNAKRASRQAAKDLEAQKKAHKNALAATAARHKRKAKAAEAKEEAQPKRPRREEPASAASPMKSQRPADAADRVDRAKKSHSDARHDLREAQTPLRHQRLQLEHEMKQDEALKKAGWNSVKEQARSESVTAFPDPVVPPPIDVTRLTDHEVVCVVCDAWTLPDESKIWSVEQLIQEEVQQKLSAAKVVPALKPEIIAHYDLSDVDARLAGMLLSRHPQARRMVSVSKAPASESVAVSAAAAAAPPMIRPGSNFEVHMEESDSDDAEEVVHFHVCMKCAKSLVNVTKEAADKLLPPPYAIANNNAIGYLPQELQDCTWAEHALTSIAYGRACIVVLRGGSQRAIRGHVSTVEMDPTVIAQRLPHHPAHSTLRVVIAGALTPLEKMATMKWHGVRKQKLQALLAFYKQHNKLYDHVQVNEQVNADLPEQSSFIDLQQDVVEEASEQNLRAPEPMGGPGAPAADASASDVQSMLNRMQSSALDQFLRQGDDAFDDGNPAVNLRYVTAVQESSAIASDDGVRVERVRESYRYGAGAARIVGYGRKPDSEVGADSAPMPRPAESDAFSRSAARLVQMQPEEKEQSIVPVPGPNDVLGVRTSARFVFENRVDILALMYPELFPYARGALNEPRRVPISRANHVAYLLRKASGQFGKPEFVLKAYNIAARAEASSKAYVRVKLGNLQFDGLTADEMKKLVLYQLSCSKAMRDHTALPNPPADIRKAAKVLFETAEICAGTMKHTDQYAKKFGRQRVWAQWHRHGPPSLMLTLNPNDLASLGLLHLSGTPSNPIPSAAVRQDILSSFPGVCAKQFHRAVEFFIRDVIGWNLKEHVAKRSTNGESAGVFGNPVALFAAVEEQGRGSLHVHILLWIEGASCAPLDMREEMKSNDPAMWELLRQKISKYIESIMTTELQCPSSLLHCPREAAHQVGAAEPVRLAMNDGPAAAAAASSSTVWPVYYSIAAYTDELHFGQIANTNRYKHVRHTARKADGQQSLAPICTCRHVVPADPNSSEIGFSVQSTVVASVINARAKLDMPPVDLTSTDAFNRWCLSTGPIVLKPAPKPTDDPAQQQADALECMRSLVNIATVQVGCMSHDASHRDTCFKKGDNRCRFHFPFAPHHFPEGEGPVTFLFDIDEERPQAADDAESGQEIEEQKHDPPAPGPAIAGPVPVLPPGPRRQRREDTDGDFEMDDWEADDNDRRRAAIARAAAEAAQALAAQQLRVAVVSALAAAVPGPAAAGPDAMEDVPPVAAVPVAAAPIQADQPVIGMRGLRKPIALKITLRRGGLSAYSNQCNPTVTSIFRCNNDVKFVTDPGSAFYVTMYHVKTHLEEKKYMLDILNAVERSHMYRAQMDPNVTSSSSLVNDYTSSLSLALRCTRAATSSTAVGATMAAYLALGHDRFICSDAIASMSLGSAERFITKESPTMSAPLAAHQPEEAADPNADVADPAQPAQDPAEDEEAGAINQAAVYAVTHYQDYLYRPIELEGLSWYEFVHLYERVRMPKARKIKKSRALFKEEALPAAAAAAMVDIDADEGAVESDVDVDVDMVREADNKRDVLSFVDPHPLRETHRPQARMHPASPIVYGDRLPDSRPIENGIASEEDKNTFARRAVLLFLPFRAADVKTIADEPWKMWSEKGVPHVQHEDHRFLKKIMQNMQTYWLGVEMKTKLAGMLGANGNGANEIDFDPDDPNQGAGENGAVHEDGDELDPAALEQMEALAAAAALGDDTPSASVLNLLACGALDKLPDVKVGSLQQSLKAACDSKTLQELRLKQFLKADVPQEVLIEEFKSDSESEPAGDEGDVLGEIERPEPAGARADWIANNAEAESDADLLAMAPADLLPFLKVFQERSPDVALDPLPATKAAVKVLQHVIDEKKLNKKQSLMFLLFGRQLFAEHFGADFTLIAPDVDHTDARGQSLHGAASRRSNDAQPVHAFLAGAAGTGKSRVIESLQFLAGLIGKSSSVLVTAMTGAAAVNVRGATVHGALHLMSDVEVVPSKLQGKLSMVSLVIIDECSMMDCTMFEKLNTRLQQGRTAGVVFGGVSIMFVGDFCQLQPVAGGGSLMSNAAVLWREHVTTVVMLDEQMRQADDIAMAHHLTAFRSGAVTQADIQYFNQKLVTNAGDVVRENLLQTLGLAPRLPGSLLGDHAAAAASSSTALQAAAAQPQVPAADDITHYRSFFPIVVADNKERTDINTAIAKNLFMRMGMNSERAFICISALYVVSHLVDADPHDPHHVDDGRDKKKKKKRVSELETKPNLIKILRTQALTVMDHQLRLFIGMEVIVTTNICVEYGIANGSHAYVTAIQLSEEAKPPTIDEFGMKQYSIADIGRVILRLLRPDGEPSVVQMESDLGPGEFAVYEDKEYIKFKPKTKKLLQMRKLGAWARKTHKILQLSIVPAFTMTAWKLQGLTLKKLVVASTLNRQNRNIAPRYLYVVLSRLKSLEGLVLLQPLPQNPGHTAYKLGKDLIGETKRLQDLEAQTAYRAREFLKLFRVHVHGGSGSAAVPSPPVAASAAAARPLTALALAYARISGRHL